MENATTKRGPRAKDPSKKKVTVSLTLTPAEKRLLHSKSLAEDCSPSQLIVKKLKLS